MNKDTQRIDEEIERIETNIQCQKNRITRLETLKSESCIDCTDSKCVHAGAATDAVCQSHTLYGLD